MRRKVLIVTAVLLLVAITAQAGGVKEIMIGAGFGTVFGVLVGGTALAFPKHPDEVTAQYLLIGGGAGLACGVLFGVFIPSSADPRSAVFNLDMRTNIFSVSPFAAIPQLSFAKSISDLNLHAVILKLDF